MQIVAVSHAGMTTEEFDQTVGQWLATAKHPKTGRPYSEMVYQPMLEVLAYLRANGFKTFIVSGGGVDFMRVFSERVYGLRPYVAHRQTRQGPRCSGQRGWTVVDMKTDWKTIFPAAKK